MARYDVNIRISGRGVDLKVEGKLDVDGLEALITNIASPATARPANNPGRSRANKPQLTRDVAYRYLRRGKDFDWFNERYQCTKMQVAAYKAWITMRGENG